MHTMPMDAKHKPSVSYILLSTCTIAAGVPYHVRVYAENAIGRGSYCITTDFGDQLSMTLYNYCVQDFILTPDSL